jgi:predicted AAA+ superfamily ATPase
MRRVGKSTLLKCHGETLRLKFPSAVILEIDKESMLWDHIRTGKDLYEYVIAEIEGKSGPFVLMVDEVQDIEDWERGVGEGSGIAFQSRGCGYLPHGV